MAGKGKTAKARTKPTTRISVTFAKDTYRTLEQIADQKKVSVAWVVRDAAAKYIEAKWPLLEQDR